MVDFANFSGCWIDFNGNWLGAAMDNLKFNYHSTRSEKARISVKFNRTIVVLLNVAAPSLLISGLILIGYGITLGWVFIGFSAIPAMIVEWYKGELRHLPIAKSPKSVDDILSGEILGRLSKQPTPHELAVIIGNLPSGHFFAVRFGVGPSFLRDITSDNLDIQAVWKEAWGIMKQTDSRNVSAPIHLFF